jgi:hypothetical protein
LDSRVLGSTIVGYPLRDFCSSSSSLTVLSRYVIKNFGDFLDRVPIAVQDKGRQKRNAPTSGPFLRFSESYCFGSGSAPKFAWTNIHLSFFFT